MHCGLLHCNMGFFNAIRMWIIDIVSNYTMESLWGTVGLKPNMNSTHHVSITLMGILNVIIIKLSHIQDDCCAPFPYDLNLKLSYPKMANEHLSRTTPTSTLTVHHGSSHCNLETSTYFYFPDLINLQHSPPLSNGVFPKWMSGFVVSLSTLQFIASNYTQISVYVNWICDTTFLVKIS
jgi:hypothetical protein